MFLWASIFAMLGIALVGAPFLLILALTIWKIHDKHTVAMKPGRIETRSEILSEEMREFVGRSVEQFRQEGFEVAANTSNPEAVTGAQGIQVFFFNPGTKDTAYLVIAFTKIGRQFAISIVSTFDDGNRLATGSRRGIGVMPRDPHVDSINFPWVKDARVLYEAHRRRLELLAPTLSARKWPEPEKVTEWLDNLWDAEMGRSVDLGYRFPDQSAGVYRYTWKGAVLDTLKVLPPVRRFRARRRNVRARREWNKLKMDEFGGADSEALPRAPDDPLNTEHSLQYLPSLAPGEIRREKVDGTLIVRIGGQKVTQLLMRRWGDLATIIFFTGCVALSLELFDRFAAIAPLFGQLYVIVIGPPAILWLLFVPGAVWRLARGLSACKGTIVLSANRTGLSFRNTPGISEGQIPREEIEGLMVTELRSRTGKKRGRLSMRLFDTRSKQVLVQSADLTTLTAIRKELSEAMEIEAPVFPPPLPVNQG